MEFYPIKKLMQEYETRHPEKKKLPRRRQLFFKTSSHSLSSKDQILKELYHAQENKKRFDREFTSSWAEKQGLKGKTPQANNFTSLTKSIFQTSTYSATNQVGPLTKRTRAQHLSQDQGLARLSSRFETKEGEGFNDDNQMPVLSSQPSQNFTPITLLKHSKSNLSLSTGFSLFKSNSNPDGYCLSPHLQVNSARLKKTDLTGEESLTKSNFFNADMSKKNSPTVFEELEEIYHKDLKTETSRITKPTQVEASPYSKEFKKKARNARKTMGESEYNCVIEDNFLLGKLEDPYGRSLPFEKHINANRKDPKNIKLQELEVKAQILRNLNSIKKIPTGSLSCRQSSTNKSNQLPQIEIEPNQISKKHFIKVSVSPRGKI